MIRKLLLTILIPIKVYANDSGAELEINGDTYTSGDDFSINLPTYNTTAISIVVTAADSLTQETYTINIYNSY